MPRAMAHVALGLSPPQITITHSAQQQHPTREMERIYAMATLHQFLYTASCGTEDSAAYPIDAYGR
jgi:hypothetical protein